MSSVVQSGPQSPTPQLLVGKFHVFCDMHRAFNRPAPSLINCRLSSYWIVYNHPTEFLTNFQIRRFFS